MIIKRLLLKILFFIAFNLLYFCVSGQSLISGWITRVKWTINNQNLCALKVGDTLTLYEVEKGIKFHLINSYKCKLLELEGIKLCESQKVNKFSWVIKQKGNGQNCYCIMKIALDKKTLFFRSSVRAINTDNTEKFYVTKIKGKTKKE